MGKVLEELNKMIRKSEVKLYLARTKKKLSTTGPIEDLLLGVEIGLLRDEIKRLKKFKKDFFKRRKK